ncbi:DUF7117 family protein [Halovivax gelatinilyticus]|uniref:DUF7117 family protein n=1 Tax=Halovivax gelatinilyticus TaxID=2961597 RepID=UPI0020CA2EF9|nr:TFIIB-type zinc ribbon-containing protein [Halovivax gelatinilyticus]
MNVRGDRRCRECGTRWSYAETGQIACPACGSLRSVGRGDRRVHTDSPTPLDLSAVRREIDDHPIRELSQRAAKSCRRYVGRRGFVSDGSLLELDDTYVGALELRYAATYATAKPSLTNGQRLYLLSLVRSVDEGERPPVADVARSIRNARGLAVSRAVRDYRRDVRSWNESIDQDVYELFESIDAHAVRVDHLDGDVEPLEAEHLLSACRSLADVLRGETTSLSAVSRELDRLE